MTAHIHENTKVKKYNLKSYDLLAEWKEKYNSKENERTCQYRNFQLIQNDNNELIKQLKEKNQNLQELIATKRQKSNKNHLKYVLKIKKSPFNANNENLLKNVDFKKTNMLVSERFLHDVDKLNHLFYERKQLKDKLKHLDGEKERRKNEMTLIKGNKNIVTVERQVKGSENEFEKFNVKFETADYVNKVLMDLKHKFFEVLNDGNKQVDLMKTKFGEKITKIKEDRVELGDNCRKRDEIKVQVDLLEKELSERKQKREEYATLIQEKLEEAKTIDIDQSKIRSDKDATNNLRQGLVVNVTKAEEDLARKEETKLKLLDYYYKNYLNLKSIATSTGVKKKQRDRDSDSGEEVSVVDDQTTEIEKLNERRSLLVGVINELCAQKCALESELEVIKSDFVKCLCLNMNLNEKGVKLIEDFQDKNKLLVEEIKESRASKAQREATLNQVVISVANLCAKMLNFKILNEMFEKLAGNHGSLGVYTNTKQSSETSANIFDSRLLAAKIPKDVLSQLKIISSVASVLSEYKTSVQANVEPHYYISEITKFVNYMQSAYTAVAQEEDSKSSDFEKDEYSFDAFSEYVSRDKIKIRSQDILNRKLKSKKSIKMLVKEVNIIATTDDGKPKV